MNTLLGKKVQQTQAFLENGTRIPVTVIAASGNVVIGLKTQDKDTYSAIQLGFGKTKRSTKALLGHVKKANLDFVPQVIQEVRLEDTAAFEPGTTVNVDEVFKAGDIVDVTGMSKGKGFAGGVKRYNFKGGPKTHGQSDRHRAPGSIGSGTTPGRVYRGKRMAGNMGRDTVTVKNLLIVEVDPTAKTLLVKGLVPGIMGSVVEITKVGEVKEKNFVPLFKIAEPEVVEVQEDATVAETQAVEQAQPETPGEQPEVAVETVSVEEVEEVAPAGETTPGENEEKEEAK